MRPLLRRRRAAGHRDVRQEVEDLTQSVFLALFADRGRTLRQWDAGRGLPLASFVGLVAEREACSILRSRRLEPLDRAAHRGRRARARGRRLRVAGARGDLARAARGDRPEAPRSPERARGGLFYLLLVDERSTEEACTITGMTADAVYAWRSRIARLVRQIAAELAAEAEPRTQHLAERCEPRRGTMKSARAQEGDDERRRSAEGAGARRARAGPGERSALVSEGAGDAHGRRARCAGGGGAAHPGGPRGVGGVTPRWTARRDRGSPTGSWPGCRASAGEGGAETAGRGDGDDSRGDWRGDDRRRRGETGAETTGAAAATGARHRRRRGDAEAAGPHLRDSARRRRAAARCSRSRESRAGRPGGSRRRPWRRPPRRSLCRAALAGGRQAPSARPAPRRSGRGGHAPGARLRHDARRRRGPRALRLQRRRRDRAARARIEARDHPAARNPGRRPRRRARLPDPGQTARPWDVHADLSEQGAARIEGDTETLFPGVPEGEWEIAMAIGRPAALPDSAAGLDGRTAVEKNIIHSNSTFQSAPPAARSAAPHRPTPSALQGPVTRWRALRPALGAAISRRGGAGAGMRRAPPDGDRSPGDLRCIRGPGDNRGARAAPRGGVRRLQLPCTPDPPARCPRQTGPSASG